MYYITVPLQGKIDNATLKAKEDVADFLADIGFTKMPIKRMDYSKLTWPQIHARFDAITDAVKPGDVVIHQTPIYIGTYTETKFLETIQRKKAKVVVLVHDVDYLRKPNSNDEQKFYNLLMHTDGLILTSKKLADIFRRRGYNKPIISREIWDYVDHNITHVAKYSNKIFFTGGLKNPQFLTKLDSDLNLAIYGPANGFDTTLPCYKGSLSPEQIGAVLTEGYGLIWNGPNPSEITDQFSSYLQYTWPHKLSLYVEVGLPVIIWSGAHPAKFVEKNKLGLVVDSLDELGSVVNSVTQEQYEEFATNCRLLSKLLRTGFFTKKSALDIIGELFVK